MSAEKTAVRNFEDLRTFQFINLTTFRKTGVGVVTPVWFVLEDGKLLGTTQPDSGKIKRIRNNPTVSIAPSTARGEVLGDSVEGQARVLDQAEFKRADAALKRKYGLQYLLISGMTRLRGGKRTFWEISPVKPE